jgi:predicted AAA+ superfamily ATPase
MCVLTGCKPRKEVLKGDLDDAIFAADFGDLIAGKAPVVYGNPKTFFQNTHPAQPLRKLVEAVFGRLANAKEPGAAIRLSTGFGGGKTHTLMALWHLAENITDLSLGTDLLPAAGRPKQVKVAAIDGSKAGVPIFARHGKTHTQSLFGELAYQLGGDKAVKSLGKNDDPESQPDAGTLGKHFPAGPVLILLDELVVYMATLSDRGQGNVLALVTKPAAIATKRPQTVLVVTDPGAQAAFASQSDRLRQGLVPIETKLDEVFGRKMSDFDPIGDESAEVIIRRLFDKVDPGAAQATSAAYHSLYDRVTRETPDSLPASVAGAAYAKSIVRSYPFHPRLLDTAKDRLGALQEIQQEPRDSQTLRAHPALRLGIQD